MLKELRMGGWMDGWMDIWMYRCVKLSTVYICICTGVLRCWCFPQRCLRCVVMGHWYTTTTGVMAGPTALITTLMNCTVSDICLMASHHLHADLESLV